MKMKQRLVTEIEKCAVRNVVDNGFFLFPYVLQRETSFDSVQLDVALRALVGLVGFFGIKLAYDEVTLCLTILGETRTER